MIFQHNNVTYNNSSGEINMAKRFSELSKSHVSIWNILCTKVKHSNLAASDVNHTCVMNIQLQLDIQISF